MLRTPRLTASAAAQQSGHRGLLAVAVLIALGCSTTARAQPSPPLSSADRLTEMSRLQTQAWKALADDRDPKAALELYRQVLTLGESGAPFDFSLYRRIAELACAAGDLDLAVDVAGRGLRTLVTEERNYWHAIEGVHLRRSERLLRLHGDPETDLTLKAYCALQQRFLFMRGAPSAADAPAMATEVGTLLARNPHTRVRGELLLLAATAHYGTDDGTESGLLQRVVDEAPRSAAAPEALSRLILRLEPSSAEAEDLRRLLCERYPEAEQCMASLRWKLLELGAGKWAVPYAEARATAARIVTLYRGHFADVPEFFSHYPYESFLQLAKRQRELGLFADALESLREAAEIDSQRFEAWAGRAAIEERRGDNLRAADDYERASRCDVPEIAGGYSAREDWAARARRLRRRAQAQSQPRQTSTASPSFPNNAWPS